MCYKLRGVFLYYRLLRLESARISSYHRLRFATSVLHRCWSVDENKRCAVKIRLWERDFDRHFQGIFCAVCSPCSTLQQGSSLACLARRTSARRLPTIIGFVPPNTSSLNQRLWRSAAFNARLLATFLPTSSELLMWRLVDVFCRLRPMVSSFGHRDSSPSMIVCFQSQALTGLPDELISRQSQPSFQRQLNIKSFCFASRIDFRC